MASVSARLAELRAEALSRSLLPSVFAGALGGVFVAMHMFSMGAIVFSGSLAPYLFQGIGILLFGCLAISLVGAFHSGHPGAGYSPPTPSLVALYAFAPAFVLEGDTLFMTMVAAMIAGSLLAGLCLMSIGRFRLANLTRTIPYPVSVGFVSGTGGLMCLSAMSLIMPLEEWRTLLTRPDWMTLSKSILGAGFGLFLYLIQKRPNGVLFLPLSFVASAVLFHIGLALLDVSGSEARANGLLLSTAVDGGLLPLFEAGNQALVDPAALAAQIPNILVFVLVTLICVPMNLAGYEVATNQDLDWDSEYRGAGLSSLISGLWGGPPGCLTLSLTMLNRTVAAKTRLAGIFAALAVASILLYGDSILELVPVPLLGGMLFFVGFDLIVTWLLKARKTLARADYAIVLSIFLCIVFMGFLEGVGFGLIVCMAFFTGRLSRVDVIEKSYTLRQRQSTILRPVPDRAILHAAGETVQVYCLRGYVFFGSAYRLAERLKNSLDGTPRPLCLLLDFSAVTGFDYSSVNVIRRLFATANAAGVRVFVSSAPNRLEDMLRSSLHFQDFDNLYFEQDIDRALERSEDTVISEWMSRLGAEDQLLDSLLEHTAEEIESHLDRQILFEELIHELRDWLEIREFAAGESLVDPARPADGMHLLITGRATAYASTGKRLFQYRPGFAIEPRSAFGPYSVTAEVVADEPSQTMMLAPAARRWLEDNEKQLAVRLYSYLLTSEMQSEMQEAPQETPHQPPHQTVDR